MVRGYVSSKGGYRKKVTVTTPLNFEKPNILQMKKCENWTFTILSKVPPLQFQGFHQNVSHEKKPYYFPLYWLVNKDPYNGLL